jgi:hypothetical protein
MSVDTSNFQILIQSCGGKRWHIESFILLYQGLFFLILSVIHFPPFLSLVR